ncbi:MAG: YggU family protein [candidate division Zixibacteria bacterium]|nr:YggU family protein [candidate division Zixibacteria bacterium]
MKLVEDKKGIRLRIYVRPGARKDVILGPHGEDLKVDIASSPVRGAANDALKRFFADVLSISPSQVEIISGRTSRHKTIRVMGVTPDHIKAILTPDP